jgi:hypothetical protein
MDPVSTVSEFPINNPVPPTTTVPQPTPSVIVPLPVKILSWLILFGGVASIFGFLITILFTSKTMPSLLLWGPVLFLSLFSLVSGVAYIAIAFGFRKMKRWALLAFTVINGVGLMIGMYNYSTALIKNNFDVAFLGISVLVLAYLWTINKKFV